MRWRSPAARSFGISESGQARRLAMDDAATPAPAAPLAAEQGERRQRLKAGRAGREDENLRRAAAAQSHGRKLGDPEHC